MANGNNANIGFEKQIWDAACVLWGHIPAAEYRKVIVGLIFLRYISSAFEKRYQELVAEGDGFEDDRDAYVEDNIFFVPEDARWSKIASSAHTPEIGTVIDDAMRAIEKENTTLKNVLPKITQAPIWTSVFWVMLLTCSPIWIWAIQRKVKTCSAELMSIVFSSSPLTKVLRVASSILLQALLKQSLLS